MPGLIVSVYVAGFATVQVVRIVLMNELAVWVVVAILAFDSLAMVVFMLAFLNWMKMIAGSQQVAAMQAMKFVDRGEATGKRAN